MMHRSQPSTFENPTTNLVQEVSWDALSHASYKALQAGTVLILRGCPPLSEFRDEILSTVERDCGAAGRAEIEQFYDRSVIPRIPALVSLSRAIKHLRARMALSRRLAPLVQRLDCEPEVLLDGGINRLVVPPQILSDLKAHGDIPPEDFKRQSADGEVEIFMPAVANIHRDFNRPHYLFQFNIWFPLHSAESQDVLRIWPNHYRSPITDLDATEENFNRLGSPLSYELNFGDAILFHGEHLHTSPAAHDLGDSYRRHTYDVRVASCAYDDNAHYRLNFWNLKNFLPDSQEKNAKFLPYELIADLLSERPVTTESIRSALECFRSLPYCDDRYFLLLKQSIIHGDLELVGEIVRVLRENSRLPAFLVAAAALALDRVPHQEYVELLIAAIHQSKVLGAYKSFAPIEYVDPCSQPTPEQYRRYCLQKLAGASSAQP